MTDRTSLSVPEASFAAYTTTEADRRRAICICETVATRILFCKGTSHETLPGSAQDRIEWLLLQSDDEVAYAAVRERVPKDMCRDANQDRDQEECEVADASDVQSARSELHSFAEGFRHREPEWLLGIAMKKPEDQEGEGKIEREDSQPCVAESSPGSKPKEVEEVRSEAADYDRRGNKAPCAEREWRPAA